MFSFFFLNATATTDIYTLSLHDALPIYFKGKPAIAGINFNFVGDSTTRMLSLMNGQASIVERLEPEQVDTVKANANIQDRKSTRLNSSHGYISYAVFCLKKKKKQKKYKK